MSTLDLPPTTPLPAEVREHVQQTVITRSGLRTGPVVAVALVAALAVMTVVMITVALSHDIAGINALARPAPVPRPDLTGPSFPTRSTDRFLPADARSTQRAG
jgi:hypothetical protein